MEFGGDGTLAARPRNAGLDGPRHACAADSPHCEGTPQFFVAELYHFND